MKGVLRRTVGTFRQPERKSSSESILVTVGNSNKCSDALVCVVIGSGKSNVIIVRIVSDDWCITIQLVSERRC